VKHGLAVVQQLQLEYNDEEIPAILINGNGDRSSALEAVPDDPQVVMMHRPVLAEVMREAVEALLTIRQRLNRGNDY
jgi:hypothetical protein